MMATIDRNADESNISSEAYSLLDGFISGLDEVVYEMAEEIAKARAPGVPVSIEKEDVEAAGKRVLQYFTQLVDAGQAPDDLRPFLDRMAQCLESSDAPCECDK